MKKLKQQKNYKKIATLLIYPLLIVVVIIAGSFIVKKVTHRDGGTKELYEALVLIRDETSADPSGASKLLKAGDVLLAVKSPHEWSVTEQTSYLILKMNLTPKEYEELTAPLDRERSKKEKKKLLEERKVGREMNEEEEKMIKEEIDNEKEIIKPRKYSVDMKEFPGFEPNMLLNGQPYQDKVYDFGVMKGN